MNFVRPFIPIENLLNISALRIQNSHHNYTAIVNSNQPSRCVVYMWKHSSWCLLHFMLWQTTCLFDRMPGNRAGPEKGPHPAMQSNSFPQRPTPLRVTWWIRSISFCCTVLYLINYSRARPWQLDGSLVRWSFGLLRIGRGAQVCHKCRGH